MSDFSAEWLALREPADWRARSLHVTNAVRSRFEKSHVVRALDLAAGTGSNARFLSRQMTSPQDWLLVDRNPGLLAEAEDRWRKGQEGREGQEGQEGQEGRGGRNQMDSAMRVEAIDISRIDTLERLVGSSDLVTASALLDLVSDAWLRGLCTVCSKGRATVLFALSYDGRIICAPPDEADDRIRRLVNRHQRTNKGFGPALGADAAARAAQYLETLGYHVVRDRSDWVIESASHDLQRALIDGWAVAAAEIDPADGARTMAWRARRLAHLEHHRSRLIVGHEDVGAFMP